MNSRRDVERMGRPDLGVKAGLTSERESCRAGKERFKYRVAPMALGPFPA